MEPKKRSQYSQLAPNELPSVLDKPLEPRGCFQEIDPRRSTARHSSRMPVKRRSQSGQPNRLVSIIDEWERLRLAADSSPPVCRDCERPMHSPSLWGDVDGPDPYTRWRCGCGQVTDLTSDGADITGWESGDTG